MINTSDKSQWTKVDPELCARLYPPAIETARAVALKHGYAIGVHGSQKRDLDLIAAPWVDECSSALELVTAIACELGWYLHPKETEKPHGRRAWLIFTDNHAHIDISVLPRQESK